MSVDGELGFECSRCDAPPRALTPLPVLSVAWEDADSVRFECDACAQAGRASVPLIVAGTDLAVAIEAARDQGWRIWKYGPQWCAKCVKEVDFKVALDRTFRSGASAYP